MLYGLSLKDQLLLPDMQVMSHENWSAVENTLMMTEPDVVVIHEDIAIEALEWFSLHEPEIEISVVVKELTARTVRYWTAVGARNVWSMDNWTMELCHGTDHEPQQGAEVPFDWGIGSNPTEMISIAVAGTYSGSGVTHTALSIAHVLAKRGRVALWEACNNPCFDFLEYNLGGSMNRKVKFDLGRKLTVFKAAASLDMVEFIAGEYDFLIYDLGCISQPHQLSLLTQATCPIIVGSLAPWRQQELIQFCRQHSGVRQDRWRIVFPNNEVISSDIREGLAGRATFALPSRPDPARPDSATVQVVEAMLGLEQTNKRKSWLHR